MLPGARLLLLTVLALALFAEPAAARLAIAGTGGLAVLEADGSNRTRLVGPAAEPETPAWSPDAQTLVFTRGGPGALELAAIGPGGLAAIPGGRGLSDASFSPDGSLLAAAQSARGPDNEALSNLVRLPASGGTPQPLTSGAFDWQPSWSPDGRWIAFTRSTISAATFRNSILLVPADGSAPPVTVVADGEQPAWSPDSGWLVFRSSRDGNGRTCFEECFVNGEIYAARADGSEQRRLTTTTGDEGEPAWSPDGTRIAFASDRHYPRGKAPEVFAMDPDGGCITQLTFAATAARSPAWEPGRPAARGPCGGRAVQFLLDLDLKTLGPPNTRPLYLGTRFAALRPSHVEPSHIVYGECDLLIATACPANAIQVEVETTCRRNPSLVDLPTTSVERRRGALVVGYGGRFEVITGGTTLVLHSVGRKRLSRALAALRPVGAATAPRRLATPRLSEPSWRRLRNASRVRRDVSGNTRRLVRSDRRVLRALRLLGARPGRAPACSRF